MLTFLQDIAEVLLNIPAYILFALESIFNLFSEAIELTVFAALSMLGELPEPKAPPTFIGWLNWFYPVGGIVSILTTLMGLYITFWSIRWLLRKAGIV